MLGSQACPAGRLSLLLPPGRPLPLTRFSREPSWAAWNPLVAFNPGRLEEVEGGESEEQERASDHPGFSGRWDQDPGNLAPRWMR